MRIWILLFLLLVLMGCQVQDIGFELGESVQPEDVKAEIAKDGHFGINGRMVPGMTWTKFYPGPFIWGEIDKDGLDWIKADNAVKDMQKKGLGLLATIWPYKESDQELCHMNMTGVELPFKELGKKRYKPCDMAAYESFVTALIERYDGDGFKDMPGLLYPLKHWEVLNEPEVKEVNRTLFSGSAEDYFELLKSTYSAAKRANNEVVILNGGISGDDIYFWEEVFKLGGGSFFDIASIHSKGNSTAFNAPELKAFLSMNGIEKKIWVTEGYIPDDDVELVKAYVRAFASGAEKVFYDCIHEPCILAGQPNMALNVLVSKIDFFREASSISDTQHRFVIGNRVAYVVWDSAPKFQYKKLRVSDMEGNVDFIEVSDFKPGASAVIVEPIED